jgi:hypothetical protein
MATIIQNLLFDQFVRGVKDIKFYITGKINKAKGRAGINEKGNNEKLIKDIRSYIFSIIGLP